MATTHISVNLHRLTRNYRFHKRLGADCLNTHADPNFMHVLTQLKRATNDLYTLAKRVLSDLYTLAKRVLSANDGYLDIFHFSLKTNVGSSHLNALNEPEIK